MNSLSSITLNRVAVVTPPGRGAVATIVVLGDDSVTIVDSQFSSAASTPLPNIPVGRIAFGRWRSDGAGGEELIVCRRDARRIEIHCHGGYAAPRNVVASLVAQGCVEVAWPELAAELETDSLAAEARIALAAARTERAASILLDQYRGALRHGIDRVIASLSTLDADVATNVTAAIAQLAEMLRWESFGRHLTVPWRVVVAGQPNVGKSSLINALLGYQRALVFDQPGTTRDVLTASTAIDGWPVELADTAGLRMSDDPIEAAGVALAREWSATADLLLLVFDASQPWTRDDQSLVAAHPRAVVVLNKCDLLAASVVDRGAINDFTAPVLTSATRGDGLADLLATIARSLVPHIPAPGTPLPFTERQASRLRAALEALRQNNPAAALLTLQSLSR